MTPYEQGFITKCAEYGIDPASLVKAAQTAMKNRPKIHFLPDNFIFPKYTLAKGRAAPGAKAITDETGRILSASEVEDRSGMFDYHTMYPENGPHEQVISKPMYRGGAPILTDYQRYALTTPDQEAKWSYDKEKGDLVGTPVTEYTVPDGVDENGKVVFKNVDSVPQDLFEDLYSDRMFIENPRRTWYNGGVPYSPPVAVAQTRQDAQEKSVN